MHKSTKEFVSSLKEIEEPRIATRAMRCPCILVTLSTNMPIWYDTLDPSILSRDPSMWCNTYQTSIGNGKSEFNGIKILIKIPRVAYLSFMYTDYVIPKLVTSYSLSSLNYISHSFSDLN